MRDSCHSDPRSDEELIAAANGGEVAAFEVLYHRYRDWVLRHAYRWTGNRDQALDVLQETFAYLLRKMPGFRLTSKMTSFLYPAVKHLSLRMRSEHRHLFMRDEDLPDVPDPATTDENVTRKDLTAALAGLPAAQREILFLRFVDGMRLDEIARGARGLSGQSTEIEYLHPSERSGHDVSLTLDVDAGVKVEEIESVNHAVHVDRGSRTTARVTLLARDSIPNKDFVLRYRVAGNRIKTAMMTHEDERGGFFTLMVYPPRSHQKIKRSPVEMVFVLDCSGSMHGAPLAKSKAAISRALRRLEPDDTFQIIRFSEGASHLGPVPVVATRENVERGLAHLATLESSGGTYMIEGIKAALDFPPDPRRLRLVTFATDGYIGNEAEIFQAIHERLGNARIFSFGIGSSTNRHLLEGMARFGKGAAAFVGLDESAGQTVDRFYERVRHPALIDIAIDWADWKVTDVYPRQIPDLFPGRAMILTGRFSEAGEKPIRLTGVMGGKKREIVIDVDERDDGGKHEGIPSVWARRKIMDLRDIAVVSPGEEIDRHITRFALDYGLVSRYTAFVAVDSRTETGPEPALRATVPVPVPDGVSYETTVATPGVR